LGLVGLVAGCALPVRAIGRIEPSAGAMILTTSQGRSRALLLEGNAAPMRWLDGHLVEVEGESRPRAILVDGWRVVEGLHGLSCWTGVIEVTPEGVGLFDRDNGVLLRLDEDGGALLAPWAGRLVLIEGYAEAGLGVHVSYYRPLFDTAGAPVIE
jgi:hypothetical protein